MGLLHKGLWAAAVTAMVVALTQQRAPVPTVSMGENGIMFGDDFFFGLATAPAHVEDRLDDSWLDFAQRGKVAAWSNHIAPETRVRFWTQPEVEINLAKQAGATVFRLGVDWGRCMPKAGELDYKAISRYGEILMQIKQKGMKVMLTLFHHSSPSWVHEFGGWTNPRAVEHFVFFAMELHSKIGHHVDYWTIFNEPHVYTILTHCAGVWPPGKEFNALAGLRCFSPFGDYNLALWNMAQAHNRIYRFMHNPKQTEDGRPAPKVGVAHHIGYVQARSMFDIPAALYNHFMATFWFPDLIHQQCDFIGLNYYGQEFIDGTGVAIVPDEEYSDAGRGVYPDGLYRLLKAYHKRYPGKKFLITENGIADDRDVVRSAYLIEHLVAIKAAMNDGVDVGGYVFWTISDNWEWADGYCPKFGLVAVNRSSPTLERTVRPTFHTFNAIATTKRVTDKQRDAAWKKVTDAATAGVERPFCRDLHAGGMTGAFGIDDPMPRKVVAKEWRYGLYETPKLKDPVGRAIVDAFGRLVATMQLAIDLLRGYLAHMKANGPLEWTKRANQAEL